MIEDVTADAIIVDIRKMLPYEGGEKIQMMTDDHIRFQVADSFIRSRQKGTAE